MLRRKLREKLNQKGYALLVVVCLLLVITVLGTNALAAASASSGTASRRKTSSQAYLYASSLLPNVVQQVEEGTFDDFIAAHLLDSPSEDDREKLEADFDEPETGRRVDVTLTMYLKDIEIMDGGDIEATLTVRVTAAYEGAEYTLAAQFNRRPVGDGTDFAWTLSSYRTGR